MYLFNVISKNIKDIEEISLDHDLGEFKKSGYDIIKYLIVEHNYGRLDLSKVIIKCHSMNPVGKLNIEKTWSNFQKRYNF